MLKGKNKGLDKDEKAIRPRDNSVQEGFPRPRRGEIPFSGDWIELTLGEGSQIIIGFLIYSQIVSQMSGPSESIKVVLDVGFGSTGDDNFQPRSTCERDGQKHQEGWATTTIATFVECVNDEDKEMVWDVREITEKVKEE